MKFDVVVGNPPYQESRNDTRDDAVYNYFYDLAESVSSKYCLISPARFLSNAGSTDKNWNNKMLTSEQLKVLFFKQKSSEVFPNTDIKGGVAVLYYDEQEKNDPIGIFTPFEELNTILNKVKPKMTATLDQIISGQGIYKFTPLMHIENPNVKNILSKSHPNDVGTGVLESLQNILFFKEKPSDQYEYTKVLGRYERDRVLHWIRSDYINKPKGHDKYRVLVPKANGSGAIGETLATPLIIDPLIGFTQTFIYIGAVNTKEEANSILKYVKSKFARTMLGILKITQDNPAPKWKYVPLQDFSSNLDIDWTRSIPEIDQQLYNKYGLSKEEIAFIEEKIEPME